MDTTSGQAETHPVTTRPEAGQPYTITLMLDADLAKRLAAYCVQSEQAPGDAAVDMIADQLKSMGY